MTQQDTINDFSDKISEQVVNLLKLYEYFKESSEVDFTEADLQASVKEILTINIQASRQLCRCICKKFKFNCLNN